MYKNLAARQAWYRKYRRRPDIKKKMSDYQRVYREKHGEEMRTYQKKYRATNKSRLNELQNKRKAINREKTLEHKMNGKTAKEVMECIAAPEKRPLTQKELDKIWAEKEKRDPWWITMARRH